MTIVVGMADCRLSADRDVTLVTYALGSCVAVIIHDPVAMVGGLLHFMLPESSPDAPQSGKSPYMFADTGISLLFREAYQMGAEKRRLRVHLTGGARMIGENDVFRIGPRNCLAAHRILWKAGVIPTWEQTGGACARTVRMEMSSGRVHLKSAGKEF